MLTYLVAFVLSALASVILTPVARELAKHAGAVDDGAEARKVHDVPTPRVGGLAIAVAFFVPIVGLFFIDNKISVSYLADPWHVAGLAAGALFMVGVGLVDDLRGLSAKVKLVAQLAVALFAFWCGYRIDVIGTPFGVLDLGWTALPVTLLWIVGIVNAINLIDGLDGLASGIALFTVTVLFVLGVVQPNIIVALTAIALAGSLVGFLRYNFNPASIFMGDSGSLFIGYVLAVTAVSGSTKSSTVVSLMIPLLALGLPVFDTSFAVVRRFISGKAIFGADRGHVHHRLLDLGLTHRQAVLAMYGGASFLGLGALGLVWATRAQAAMILTVMGIGTLVFSRALGYLSFRQYKSSFRYGLMRQQRLQYRLGRITEAVAELRQADDVTAALDVLTHLIDDIEVDRFDCRFAVTTGAGLRRYHVRHPEDDNAAAPRANFELEFPLEGHRGPAEVTGTLRFMWNADDEQIRVPEAGAYDWIAMVLTERVLTLAARGAALPLRDRVKTLPPA